MSKRISKATIIDCIRHHARSPLMEIFNPFGELTCGDTPLTTDLESGQSFATDQAFYRSLRHLQQLSGLAVSEQLQRIKISFHRRWAN